MQKKINDAGHAWHHSFLPCYLIHRDLVTSSQYCAFTTYRFVTGATGAPR